MPVFKQAKATDGKYYDLDPFTTSVEGYRIKEVSEPVVNLPPVEPQPPVTPKPEPQPEPTSVWPNANNTGPRSGVTLAKYTGPYTINRAGTVISGKTIDRMVTVMAANVTFRDCLLTSNDSWSIQGDAASNLTVEYCEATNGDQCLLIQGAVRYCNLHGMRIAITLKDGATEVIGNYIHDLDSSQADPHFDGIFISGGQNDCLIQDNLIEAPGKGGTASIFIATRWQGSNIRNITVNHNRLLGTPSYAMYSEQTKVATISGVKWTNNEVQRGAYGYWTITGNSVVRTGNKDAFTGANIDNNNG